MSKISFTKEQMSAVSSRGGDILVSAAAGSGKTAVLTERVIERLINDRPFIPADRLMIVTFTRASAAEMKARIMKKLSQLSLENPENKLIRNQINLFERSRIGTIHSCCVEILKDNFNLLSLPSDFRLGEEDEIKKIQLSCVHDIFEEKFQEGSKVFASLCDLFGGQKDDGKLCDAILKILEFAHSVPFYEDWFSLVPKMYEIPKEGEITPWEECIFNSAEREMNVAVSFFDAALTFCTENGDLDPYCETLEKDILLLDELQNCIEDRDLDGAFAFFKNLKFPTLKNAKEADADDKKYAQTIRNKAKEIVNSIPKKLILSSRQDLFNDLEYFKPIVEELFSIAQRADRDIFQRKIEEKVIDFSDLEQLTLKLLWKKDESGNLVKTDAAKKLSSDIDEIMIDEYQDVNRVQDAILKALSNGENRFMVGDVKQSIYRFRQACPDLFIDMLSSFHKEEEGSFPRKILLNGNFRTRKEIAEFINFIFCNIMTEKTAEINYSDGHMLESRAEPQSDFRDNVEIITCPKADFASASEAEAEAVACKVKEILDSHVMLKSGDEKRELIPSDIAILMRNPKNKASIYQDALLKKGIKSSALKNDDFMTSFEIKPMLNLLTAICNPVKSMELSGAMLSPIFGFSDEEVAKIRRSFKLVPVEKFREKLFKGEFKLHRKGGRLKLKFALSVRLKNIRIRSDKEAGNLYTALSSCKKGSAGYDFKVYFDSLIAFSKTNTPSSLISRIYYDTGYKTLVSSMENGEYMEERLSMLLVLAGSLKERGISGLNGFLKALDAMRESAVSISSKGTAGGKDSVTITSIHSSKGLEWPVVILSETASTFSFYNNDQKNSYILDKSLGFASVRRDDILKSQFPTIPLAAARGLNKKLSSAEEMRLLYVAMTRAKEKLIITASVSDPEEAFNKNLDILDDSSYEDVIYSKTNYFDWILSGLRFMSVEEKDSTSLCRISTFSPKKVENEEDKKQDLQLLPDLKTEEEIKKRLDFSYKFKKAAVIPSKIAASKLSGNLKTAYAFSKKPEFIKEEEGISSKSGGSRRGNAFHKFMQVCSFKNACEDVENEAKRLLDGGFMDEEEMELVDTSKIEKLLREDLGKLIFSSDKVLREFRFFAPATVSPIAKELIADEETATVLEGVADLILIKDREIYLIDYKTDRVHNENELRELYKNQVLLYKAMLSHAFTFPVKKVLLYSFHLGKTVEIREKDLI